VKKRPLYTKGWESLRWKAMLSALQTFIIPKTQGTNVMLQIA